MEAASLGIPCALSDIPPFRELKAQVLDGRIILCTQKEEYVSSIIRNLERQELYAKIELFS